ncbi:MAG TPA: marine proteobacterial sortase target protein [Thermoanaerobaculia bacterium]|nr:marine proteobacterial sortase target protein [Thermoanaerobaculia bacterium]
MRRNRFLTAGLLLSLLIAGRVAAAEEKPFDPNRGGLLLRGEKGFELPAPALGTTIEMRVTGVVARTKVTQVFQNPTKEWLTGVYLFPLPEGAAVDTLRMVVGDRVLEGLVQEKEQARQTLAAASSAECGCKASLLEQLRPGLFTLSVANVGPDETVEIEIGLQQVVRYEQGRFVLRFPTLAPPRYSPPTQVATLAEPEIPQVPVLSGAAPRNPFALHVDLAPGFPLAGLGSSTHDVAVEEDRKHSRWAVDLARGVVPSDGDFVLEWAPAVGREPRAVYFVEEVDGERYSLLMMLPPDDAQALAGRLPRETIFVIDNSGSMSGTPLEQAKEALLRGLDRLQPGDWLNVMKFSTLTTALFPDSVPATPQTLEQARSFVRGLGPEGGTEMLPALQLALAGRGATGLVRQVIFATDGEVSNEADILAFLPSHLGDRRLFTIALGVAPNAAFLRRAAELGRGSFTQITSLAQVAEGMADLFARLESPMLRDIQVQWSDPAAEAWPARIPDLYLGEPLVVSARLGEPGPVAVSGQRSGSSWEDELPAPAPVKGAGLDRLWAGRKVQALMDSLQDGGDAEEVRQAVLELGLRHHLVTPYTSLVAVDVQRTAPPGVEPSSRMIPLNRPRDSDGVHGMVEETITLTAESPLLDERRISTWSTVSQTEIEKIPSARDPWAVLQRTPGVLVDRVNVGGNESGQQVVATVAGTAGQNLWAVDGVTLTDMAAISSSPGYFDFDAFEEMQVETGGADVTLETPGARVQLIRPRGTNEWRASGFALWSGGPLSEGSEGSLDSLRVADLDTGGPLVRDRLWGWGEAGRDEIDRVALGGQEEARVRESGSFQLNAQPGAATSVSLMGSGGRAEGSGAGAGPSRSPETTWDEEGREALWSAEVTHVASSSLFLTGSWGGSERNVRDLPRREGDVLIDAAGVARGSWFGIEEEQKTREARLISNLYFTTGPASHDILLGSGWRSQDEDWTLAAPDRMGIAGDVFRLPDGLAVSEAWQSGTADARTETYSLWGQDTLNLGPATLVLGARLDRQDLGILEARPWTLAPRLGLSWALGAERTTLLKASVGRFASRIGSRAAWHLDPDAPAVRRSFFEDLDGDLLPGAGEPFRPWHGEGIDTVDPDLRPEITDEAVLGIEHALWPELLIGLRATWRQTRHLLEERLLVRDASTGEVFAATASDWLPTGRLTGVLPDGAPYDVAVWDLRDDLSWTGGTLLVNGDRRQDDLGLSLTWNKRLSQGWMTRGHVSWHDGDQRLGSEFRLFDDPTNTVGGLDDEGFPVTGADSSRPHERLRFQGSHWSFHASGLVELPWQFRLAGALNGREGSPLPWFRQVARERSGPVRVQLTDRPDAFRTSDIVTFDLRLDREIMLSDTGFTLSLEAFNLFGERNVLHRELDLGVGRGGAADEVLAPRTLRLGVHLAWR